MAKLTDTKVSKAQKKDKAYKLSDGGGLFLFVTTTGSKLWRWQYRFRGAPRLMALGSYPDLSLGNARDLHDTMRQVLKKGVDPMEIRKAEKSLQTPHPAPVITKVEVVSDEEGKKFVRTTLVVNTFAWVQAQWFDKWAADKNARHAATVAGRVERDILPRLGHRPIAEIEAPEIAAVALAIQERGALDVAHRSLHTMSQVFRFGISRGFCRRHQSR